MRGAWEKPLFKNRDSDQPQSSADHHHLKCSDEDSSDEDHLEEESAAVAAAEAAIFTNYPQTNQVFDASIARVTTLVTATITGSTSCLICLEKIRKSDPIWHCSQSCFAILHLICIQSWSNQGLNPSRSVFPNAQFWHCPKCRNEYSKDEIPREYRCFCGKQPEPEPDAWLLPHTCGERCERQLFTCDHTCMLLCHPGPCPPCPQLVELSCHCGGVQRVVRCGQNGFSCQKSCGRRLSCGLHVCERLCHGGECGGCEKAGLHSCRCGAVREVRPCSEAGFQCDKVCESELSCKRHVCGKRCHAGPCGECELQGRRTCPCGKEQYKDLACDVKVPTCGSTCEKVLDCGRHRCPERCHAGPCAGACRILFTKSCRCGSLKKEVPCFQSLVCERKCQNIRNCQRHACRRRCCDGDCPSCPEVCGRRLRCGNHKCPAPCHRGLCAPCPLTVRIPCACGNTALEVPCGADRDVRPPKCSKSCQVQQICGHGEQCKRHRCHFGACSPCQLTCNKELPCRHHCIKRCHGPRPAPVPATKLSRKKRALMVPTEGSPCPPCSELVPRQCLGNHPGGEKLVPCIDPSKFSCGSLCGNVLSCTNHSCEKLCHEITVRLPGSAEHEYDSCGSCQQGCEKERYPKCQHPCEIGCHPGKCPPCRVKVKRSCHCGTLTLSVECHSFNSLTAKKQLELLCCKGPCHRKLENCSHMCSQICHPGACPQLCHKKVIARCSCQRLRKVMPCFEAQQASTSASLVGVLPCDQLCSEAKASAEYEQTKTDYDQTTALVELKKQQQPRQRKSRNNRKTGALEERSRMDKLQEMWLVIWKWGLVVLFVVVTAMSVYYGVQGLRSLSDWMNEVDAHKPRKKLVF